VESITRDLSAAGTPMLPAFRTEFWHGPGKDDVGGFSANCPQQSVKLRTGHIRAARDNKDVSSAVLRRGKAASLPIRLAKLAAFFNALGL